MQLGFEVALLCRSYIRIIVHKTSNKNLDYALRGLQQNVGQTMFAMMMMNQLIKLSIL